MKLFSRFFTVFLAFSLLVGCDSVPQPKTVGIIIPIEHKAMNEIVAGFTETLQKKYNKPLQFKIANAQGDLNLQRAIIQQMQNAKVDLIVPIGLGATQMAVARTHQPILSLASTFSDQQRKSLPKSQVTAVNDEISPAELIHFFHEIFPKINQVVLVHSSEEKIYADVTVAMKAGKKLGITIKPMMIPTLNELYSVANSLPQTTQAILVLKDNLIASGISTLQIAAQKRHIALMAADQGSVQDGAQFALGVVERDIGVTGAPLALAILNGTPASAVPMKAVSHLTVFVNKNSLDKANQSFAAIAKAASNAHYPLQVVGAHND